MRHTLGRFLSLLLLSALAVAFLAGLRTTAPDMKISADLYYDAQGFMDVRVLSTLGLTDDDIAFLAAQEGVAAAEGGYTIDAIAGGVQNDFIVKALSLSEAGINAPKLVNGRLPQGPGECLVEPKLLASLGLALGDEVTLDTGTGTYEDALSRKKFTIVGTANSPLYISTERGSSSLGSGKVSAFLLLPREVFTMEAYTDAYLTAQGAAPLLSYGAEYKDLADALIDRLEPLGKTRAAGRHDEVIGEATDKLDEAQQEFDDAEAEAEQELSDAKAELDDARKKLDDGWTDYYEGGWTFSREIADAEEKIKTAEEVDLPDALTKLVDGEADYADGVRKLDEARKEYEDGLAEYQDGYDEITGESATYNDALEQLRSGETDYAAGVQTFGRGLDQLRDGGQEIRENEKKLQDALDQLFEGSQALSAGQGQLGQQQGAFAQLQGGYTQLLAAMAAGGMDSADPAALAGQVGAQIGAATMAGTEEVFYQTYVAPLGALLGSLQYAAEAAGADASQIAAARSALPTDSASMTTDLAVSAGAMVMGVGTAGGALTAMQALLEQGQITLDSAQTSLAWGQMEYDDGKQQLLAAKRDFYDAADELQDAGRTLADARAELDDGWAELRSGEKEMDDGWAELNDAKLTLNDGWAQLLDGEQVLLDARKELDDGWEDYRQGLIDLEDAKVTLAEERTKGLKQLRDALAELEDGEADYAQGLVDYEDGRREADEELSDARKKLNDARREIGDIESCKWYILGRNANIGYVSFQQDAERMGNLASVFPLIFFLVAALVCLTTMTRMVEEHRVQIGGLKALGYGKWAISVKYVGYGLAASLLGGGLGLAFGCTVIPWIIYTAWTVLYTLGPLTIPFYPAISLVSVGAAVLTVAGSAFLTCFGTLSSVPAALMRPKAPKAGKRVILERIGFLWKRLSFTQKVTVRNLFRYKRRFWMTVIGIGGCTALIVTGFGLRDSIFSIMDSQYDTLYRYTSQIGLVDDVTEDERTEVYRALDAMPNVTGRLLTRQESLTAESDRRTVEAALFAGDPAALENFVTLRHRLDDTPVTLTDDGAVLTEKLASLLGVKPGDEIILDGETRVTVRVADVTENYIGHFIYLSPAYYRQVYGTPLQGNLILARYAEDTAEIADAVSSALIPLAGVTSVSRITDIRQTYQSSLESVDYAVVVIIVAAAALAFVVLFNLTNINITERMRELATLKVLGFRDRELEAYVFRENALLTVFGVLMGLVMGKFLHQWLVLTVEIDMLMFGRSAKPMSYLLAVLLTVFFSVVVNLVAGKKLKKIDMVESLKTVE